MWTELLQWSEVKIYVISCQEADFLVTPTNDTAFLLILKIIQAKCVFWLNQGVTGIWGKKYVSPSLCRQPSGQSAEGKSHLFLRSV